jgi:hypothetical protein
MVHTVYLDDTTINGRKLLKELRRYKKGVQFENSIANNVAPEGYMTSEDFWKEADRRIINVCKQYGIL